MVLDSVSYLCAIPPIVSIPQTSLANTTRITEGETELLRATAHGSELLEAMQGNCLYFVSGWWSYSFCYNAEIRQFHQLPPGKGGVPFYPPTEDNQTPSYVLGRFHSDRNGGAQGDGRQITKGVSERNTKHADFVQLQSKGELRFLVRRLVGGTPCDLTGKERNTEVQFHCHPQGGDRIGWIKELTTCSYLMVIYTPRLCSDLAFLPLQEIKTHVISCHEVIQDEEFNEKQGRQSIMNEQILANANFIKVQARTTMRGIEIGGLGTVASDGQGLMPRSAFETSSQVDVVASFNARDGDGTVQRWSNEELQRSAVNPAKLEQLIERLKDYAAGQSWYVEIIHMPYGLVELKGVAERSQEDDGNTSSEKQTTYTFNTN